MRHPRAPERQHVHLLIQAQDGSGEGVWATPSVAPGIFEFDNFPISCGDYTLGDLVMAADDGDGHLYIIGLAERRFRGTYLRCEAVDVEGPRATARHRAIAGHLESRGVLLESLIVGWYGAAVPVGMSGEPSPSCWPARPTPFAKRQRGTPMFEPERPTPAGHRRHRFMGHSIDLPEDLTEAQLDGRACIHCAAEEQPMKPVEAWSELSSQLFECVDVEACADRRGLCYVCGHEWRWHTRVGMCQGTANGSSATVS